MSTSATPRQQPRAKRLEQLRNDDFDVVIVGGGVTGAGLALDLKARGLDVALVERGDWAGATSSSSSRLIHGGLRYLEQFELGLVRESCLERALLLRNAAGLVWPETFAFPVRKGDRVGRMKLMAGLSLYTALSVPRRLGWPGWIGRKELLARVPGMQPEGLKGAGTYLDGATDDARLALATIRTANSLGATCVSRVEATRIENGKHGTSLEVRDVLSGDSFELKARAAILAAGPFTDALRGQAGLGGEWIEPTRGSHILVDRARLPTEGAVIFTSCVDGRVMFLIPWPGMTAIGTTDLDSPADPNVSVTPEEVEYLLESANGLVPAADLTRADVRSTWVGLRPLLKAPASNPSARSREERVVREDSLYTIAGGKLTGYRSMAEGLGRRIARDLDKGNAKKASPTRSIKLVGALDAPVERTDWSRFHGLDGREASPFERRAWARDKRYGALRDDVTRAVDGSDALDAETVLGEVDWAVEHEDCLGLEDFLFRRTDVGYAPLAELDNSAPMVIDRMAKLLDWDAERRAEEQAKLGSTLERLHGWRNDDA